MAIGPQLPPHLAKRKRDADDGEQHQQHLEDHTDPSLSSKSTSGSEKRPRVAAGPSLPPAAPSKHATVGKANPDEAGITDSASDDENAGPQLPSLSSVSEKVQIQGPQLPVTTLSQQANPDEIGLDSSDDEVGPQKPTTDAPSAAQIPAARGPRTIGPAMPPPGGGGGDGGGSAAADLDSDSDDDDLGPAPLPPGGSGTQDSISAFDRAEMSTSGSSSQPTGPQRDAWMLAPPDGSDWADKVDPTKLRNRRFASGPRAGSGGAAGLGNEWTETPEEKRRRLENAVLGVVSADASTSSSNGPRRSNAPAGQQQQHQQGGKGAQEDYADARRRRADEETEQRVREYNERHRGESLTAQHAAQRRHRDTANNEEEDDPSARAFDRDKDIGGNKVNHRQKREMMDRAAASFGSRFAKGSFL